MVTLRTLLIVAIFLPACALQSGADLSTSPMDRIVQAARADAAQRSRFAPGNLTLILAESVTWADSSLGCPRPGLLYTQTLVPGYRVQLRVGDEVFDYHAGVRGGLVLCPPGLAQEPAPDSRD